MEMTKKEMEEIAAEQRFSLAFRTSVKTIDVFGLCPGSKVLIYREKKKLGKDQASYLYMTVTKQFMWIPEID